MDEFIYPAEAVFAQQHAESSDPHAEPKVMGELRARAKSL